MKDRRVRGRKEEEEGNKERRVEEQEGGRGVERKKEKRKVEEGEEGKRRGMSNQDVDKCKMTPEIILQSDITICDRGLLLAVGLFINFM